MRTFIRYHASPAVICPPLPTYSDMTFNDTNREYGTVVTYYCHEDYIYEDIKKDPKTLQPGVNDGNRTSFCTAGMWWEPAVYVCVGKLISLHHPGQVDFDFNKIPMLGQAVMITYARLLVALIGSYPK